MIHSVFFFYEYPLSATIMLVHLLADNCMIIGFWSQHFLTSLFLLLFDSIIDGQVKSVDGEISKSILENNKCYMLDCGSDIFVWVGRLTQVDERKAAIQVVEVKFDMVVL